MQAPTRKHWIPFYWHMHFCISAGLAVDAALKSFHTQKSSRPLRSFLKNTLSRYQQGRLLSEAWNQKYVPDKAFTLTLLKSAEETGCYAEAFKELAAYQTWRLQLLSKLTQVFQYPLFLLCLALLMLGFTLFVLVPELYPLLQDISQTPVPMLETLYHLNLHLTRAWPQVLACFMSPFIAFMALYACVPAVRRVSQPLFYRLPIIGRLSTGAEMAAFSKQLATLLAHQIRLTDVLNLQHQTATSGYLKQLYGQLHTDLIQGAPLSQSLEKSGFFDPLLCQMTHAGEQSGTLSCTLKTASTFYTDRLHHRIDTLMRLLPMGILMLVGSIFVFIMAQVILPLYEGISSVGL